MPLLMYLAFLLVSSEEVPQASSTPIIVPIALVILVVLIFVWGVTRGNIEDENLIQIEGATDHSAHDEVDAH